MIVVKSVVLCGTEVSWFIYQKASIEIIAFRRTREREILVKNLKSVSIE